jgi:hypothetical protein
MGKKLAAMGYAAMACKTFNDIYLPRFGKSKTGVTCGHLATRLAILIQDIFCALRLLNPALVCLVAFKTMPDGALCDVLKSQRFCISKLPVNPYS